MDHKYSYYIFGTIIFQIFFLYNMLFYLIYFLNYTYNMYILKKYKYFYFRWYILVNTKESYTYILEL